MGISNRLLGKKNVNGHPHIEAVHPSAALPGGEVRIIGSSLRPPELRRPQVRFGEVEEGEEQACTACQAVAEIESTKNGAKDGCCISVSLRRRPVKSKRLSVTIQEFWV